MIQVKRQLEKDLKLAVVVPGSLGRRGGGVDFVNGGGGGGENEKSKSLKVLKVEVKVNLIYI